MAALRRLVIATAALAFSGLSLAAPASAQTGVSKEFVSASQNDTKLRYVKNSGICETTPGVEQISGYIDVGKNMSMWFWFFEARESPETAPFTLWLNGGPGCSSMIGLFQENGPCLVTPAGNETFLNPYSWNNVSNMIYIDQPIGTGFSYGRDPVNSTEAAAPWVWKAFQILFESGEFSKYQSREFVFATESYGGHYGPAFVTYFNEQNAKITSGTLKNKVPIDVSAMLINNGWYDPLIQNQAYVDFAADAPGYGPLVDAKTLKKLNEAFYGSGGCQEQETACLAFPADTNNATSDEVCHKADNFCIDYVFTPAVGNRDPDDLRQNSSALFPPEYYTTYLALPEVLEKIGATSTYGECPDPPYNKFVKTGDDARSWLPQLSELVNSGLRTLIWAGDADINCNWLGGHASVLAMDWYGNATLHATPLTNMTIDGEAVAAIQNVDNFTFARVYGAGHEVAAFKPAAALEIFKQVIAKEPLHSV